jgi:hypothetical protein
VVEMVTASSSLGVPLVVAAAASAAIGINVTFNTL